MSTRPKYGIRDNLEPEEIEKLPTHEKVRQAPDAQIVEWPDSSAITTPAAPLAWSIDRLKGGGMTPPHYDTLSGFSNEFSENGEPVVIAGKDLRDILGNKAIAKLGELGRVYAVDVRRPREVSDTVDQYKQNYAGNPQEFLSDEIASNHVVMPVLFDESGVIRETPITLMDAEGILQSDRGMTAGELIETELEGTTDIGGMESEKYRAPEDERAEYCLDVMLPPGYDKVDHTVIDDLIIVETEEEKLMETFSDLNEVINYKETNGIYTIEVI